MVYSPLPKRIGVRFSDRTGVKGDVNIIEIEREEIALVYN